MAGDGCVMQETAEFSGCDGVMDRMISVFRWCDRGGAAAATSERLPADKGEAIGSRVALAEQSNT